MQILSFVRRHFAVDVEQIIDFIQSDVQADSQNRLKYGIRWVRESQHRCLPERVVQVTIQSLFFLSPVGVTVKELWLNGGRKAAFILKAP